MEMEQAPSGYSLPKDLWGIILKYVNIYDIIFIRATSTGLYKLSKEYQPFPKYFVLDQDKCMEYIVENGYISCLDYVKNILRFEWTNYLCSLAARVGQIQTLKHLTNNGLALDTKKVLLACTKGTCDIAMIKYLHEHGVPWDQVDPTVVTPYVATYSDRNQTLQTAMENMAYHGHLDCMKYAVDNGCTQRHLSYTPSIECLEYAIKHDFDWKNGDTVINNLSTAKRNICEEAAKLGDLAMLKYAHVHGAPLKSSALIASFEGHLECLIYAMESASLVLSSPPKSVKAKTLACFKYLVQKYGLDLLHQDTSLWFNQLKIGNIDILRYMLEHKFPLPFDSGRLMVQATVQQAFASYELFKFALDEAKWPLTSISIPLVCATFNNPKGFKQAIEVDPDEMTSNKFHQIVNGLVKSSHLDLLKLMWEKFPDQAVQHGISETILKTAAGFSTPEILEYLTNHGAQWTTAHLKEASTKLNLLNLAYLIRSGCQPDEELISSIYWYTTPMFIKYIRERMH